MLQFTDGTIGASLPLVSVAREAVRDGRTLVEAAALAIERLVLTFTAVHNGQLALSETSTTGMTLV